MSKTLGNIREAFQDPILIKQGNHFILSERGEKLKIELPALLQSLDNLYLPQALNLANSSRKYSLASSDYVAQFVLPNICSIVKHQAPLASVDFQLWHKNWLTQLSESSLDLVTTIADQIPENLYGKRMAEDIQVIVLRKNHPSANNLYSLNDYLDQKHILISGGGDKNSPIDDALTSLGKRREVLVTVPFFQSAMELLIKSDAILTIPLHIAANYSRHFDITLKPLPINIKQHHYYILWHAKHHHNAEHKWFRELCLTQCQKHLHETLKLGMKLLHSDP